MICPIALTSSKHPCRHRVRNWTGKRLLTIVADQEIIFTVEEAPEGGYTARALGYAIFTQGETLEELRQMVRDAVNCHFEKENKRKLIRLHMVKDEVMVA